MLRSSFHRWERRLASVDDNRKVRPFEWGADWIPASERPAAGSSGAPGVVRDWAAGALRHSETWFAAGPPPAYESAPVQGSAGERLVTFPSAIETPDAENNTVFGRYFLAAGAGRGARRRAVVVMAQWNADADGHVALCRLLQRVGISALRMTLPYHEQRRPAGMERADYVVSPNVARTLQVCRQAVLDARRAVAWLHQQGYERIGLLGTSLGSCLAMLAAAHEPLVDAIALNHVSPWFADVIWEGLSTAHVRAGLEGHVDLPSLRELWKPISPQAYLGRIRDKPALLVYALYDLTFPLPLSRELVASFRLLNPRAEVRVLPCGHYTTGVTPFKYIDGYYLVSFLRRRL